MKKIVMLETDVNDFVSTARRVSGAGFSFRYDEDEGALIVTNLEGDFSDWKNLPEYTEAKTHRKFIGAERLILRRLALQEIISSSVPSAAVKAKATAKLSEINAELVAIFA
jgi:hypothetical protein